MQYILYAHPESSSLFWSEIETEGDGLLVEVGRSDTPDTEHARELYYAQAMPEYEQHMPNFDTWTYSDFKVSQKTSPDS